MEPRFTRGEYWILETAVESRFPVADLMDNDIEVTLNKKGHGRKIDSLNPTYMRK